MSEDILICANPRAGSYKEEDISRIVTKLRESGKNVEFIVTTHEKEIVTIAKNLDSNISFLVIYGGDGSINEALWGLWLRQKPMPYIVIIPGGTANVLAHELGLFRSESEIVNDILQINYKKAFFSIANNRPFLLMCSIGADAEVVHKVSLLDKNKFGKLAYVIKAFKVFYDHNPNEILVTLDDNLLLSGKLIIISNSAFYGGPYKISNSTSITAPWIEVIILKNVSLLSIFFTLISLIFFKKDYGLMRLKAKKVFVHYPHKIYVQMDGEPYGFTPIEINNCGDCINII